MNVPALRRCCVAMPSPPPPPSYLPHDKHWPALFEARKQRRTRLHVPLLHMDLWQPSGVLSS